MSTISLDMLRAAPFRQDRGRPRVPQPVQERKDSPIMTQAFADALTAADRARVDSRADLMLSTALAVLQAAHETALGILGDTNDLCTATGRELPPKAFELYAYLLPRQAATR